jgi:hypothetical protein
MLLATLLVLLNFTADVCRTRLQQLASSVAVPSSEQLAAAATARRPKSKKSALAGLRLDDGVHVNSVDSRPAKKTAGGFGLQW